jgi:hypothetical protein
MSGQLHQALREEAELRAATIRLCESAPSFAFSPDWWREGLLVEKARTLLTSLFLFCFTMVAQ